MKKKLRWYNLALMSFVMVWNFGNGINNYANQGLTVIISWVLIIGFYFIPYALMVGEMGSTFQGGKAGVSTWIRSTMGPTVAYLAGWTYWAVHVPNLAQKPQQVLIAFCWGIFHNGQFIKTVSPMILQLITLVIFVCFLWVASRGVVSLKRIGTVAGAASLIMGFMYILLMLAAPILREVPLAPIDFSPSDFIPNFGFDYFTTLSMLVFAVGGAERISPYVNNTNNPAKEFPRAMIAMAICVTLSALLGSIAMGMMFDSHNIPKDLKMNGQYYAFLILGEYYGVGNLLLIMYAFSNFAVQISALIFSIDAPLKVLLGEVKNDSLFIPKVLGKVNRFGAPINGYKMTGILVGILILIPTLGIGNMNDLYNWLLDLNTIVMPMRYMWVFIAYMAMRKAGEKYFSDYKFVQSRIFGIIVAGWCFVFTGFACIMGMFPKGVEMYTSQWYFQLSMNLLTPIILIGMGLIMPIIAKKTNRENHSTGEDAA